MIRGGNLTGAGLLGVERSRLNSRRFRQFLTVADRRAFAAFLVTVFRSQAKVTFEAALLSLLQLQSLHFLSKMFPD